MTGTRSITVHPAGAVVRREVGAQAWPALEILVAASGSSQTTVATSVRSLAGELGVSKNSAARALAVLRAAGLIELRQARASTGAFDVGSYELRVPVDLISVSSPSKSTVIPPNDAQLPRTRGTTSRLDPARPVVAARRGLTWSTSR